MQDYYITLKSAIIKTTCVNVDGWVSPIVCNEILLIE